MRVKRSRNVKHLFYKNNAGKNGTFHMHIMLKGGNKHARKTYDFCSRLSIQAQKQRRIFPLWTTSIIPVVSLLLTFNKYTVSGVLSFSIHYFYVSKYNQWEWTQMCIRTFEKERKKEKKKKKKMSAGKKTIEGKKTIF